MIALLNRLKPVISLKPITNKLWFSSIQNINLKEQPLSLQKAILAEKTIKMIFEKSNDYDQSCSLRDNIVKMIEKAETTNQAKHIFL